MTVTAVILAIVVVGLLIERHFIKLELEEAKLDIKIQKLMQSQDTTPSVTIKTKKKK